MVSRVLCINFHYRSHLRILRGSFTHRSTSVHSAQHSQQHTTYGEQFFHIPTASPASSHVRRNGIHFISLYLSLFSCASSWSSRLGLYMIHTLHVRRPLSNLKFTLLGESVSIARKTTNQKISFSLFAVRFCVWCVIDVSFAWLDCLSWACASSYVFCVVFLLACSPA